MPSLRSIGVPVEISSFVRMLNRALVGASTADADFRS
jgi:hypothetical protein